MSGFALKSAAGVPQVDLPAVLVVEDDPELVQGLCASLSAHCKVIVAADAAAALTSLEGQTFDLVLLDLILPKGTGLDVLGELAYRADAPPVLVMSALAATVDLSPFQGIIAGLLTKPFGLKEVERQVAEALAGRRQARSPAKASRASLLLVDDDPAFLEAMADYLRLQGYQVVAELNPTGALEQLSRTVFDAVVTDWIMPGRTGLDLIQQVHDLAPRVPVLMLTGFATPDMTREALRKGAADVLVKPFPPQALPVALEKCLHQNSVNPRVPGSSIPGEAAEGRTLGPGQRRYRFDDIVGSSSALQRSKQALTRMASLDACVLILGETGTGKEMFAQALHDLSPRSKGPFVAVNAAAIPESLLESELFGYAYGAFSGARKEGQKGKFLLADGGTLLLDEIGDLPLPLQVKLLRVLQEGEVDLVGGGSRKVDVRIVAATHRDLRQMVAEGSFRSDLFYRLNAMTLHLPPLRERKEDISELAQGFLAELRLRYGRPGVRFSAEAIAVLNRYSWPGNIRELRNAVERAFAFSGGNLILPVDLPSFLLEKGEQPHPSAEAPPHMIRESAPVREGAGVLASQEREAILRALAQVGGNKVKAAKLLGISRAGLYIKLKVHGIQ